MRLRKEILIQMAITILILIVVFFNVPGINNITGKATTGNAKICVASKPTLNPIGNLSGTTDEEFFYDVDHTIANGDPVIYSDTADFFTIGQTDGVIYFTPLEEDVGNHTIIIMVNNTACPEIGDSEEINFEIIQGNRAPVMDPIPDYIVWEDTYFHIDVNATDPDGDNITFSCNASASQFVINSTTGSIDWIPTNDDVGVNWYECNATDDYGKASDNEIFYIQVRNTNDIPIIELIPNFTVESGDPLYEDKAFYAQINATDPDGDPITFIDNTPLFVINSDSGEIYFTPVYTDVGNYTVEIYATDGIGPGIGMQEVLFEILEVNDEPIMEHIGAQTAKYDSVFTLQVNVTDEEDGSNNPNGTGNLTFNSTGGPSGFEINSTTGVVQFTPTESQMGNYTINISVTDRGIPYLSIPPATRSEVISFSVTQKNRAPNITSFSPETPFEMETGETQEFNITAEDPDGGNPSIEWYLENKNQNIFVYSYNFSTLTAGTYNLTAIISDGEYEDMQEWTIIVENPPPPPIIGDGAGGGSGGGRLGGAKETCIPLWVCTDWSTCMITNIQIRECIDINGCEERGYKVTQDIQKVRPCVFMPIESCFDGVRNQNEILPDCGGVCKPCPTCNDNICNQGEFCEICEENPNDPRCPRDIEGNIIPDCGGPCPVCTRVEHPLQLETLGWKDKTIKISKISLSIILALIVILMLYIKIMRFIIKNKVMTDTEKSEVTIIEEISSLIKESEHLIFMKDIEKLKKTCYQIEKLYNTLSSTKNKKRIYPQIRRLKRAIKIGFKDS